MSKVMITGASGLLGRALVAEFKQHGCSVTGLAKTRPSSELICMDLLDMKATSEFILGLRPDVIVHSAALRYPDEVNRNPELAHQLNVSVSQQLAELASKLDAQFLYISTDYVFDGEKPPHKVDDTPRPLNFYGETKLEGEQKVLSACAHGVVLRVPVLYGPVEHLNESAVTSLFLNLLNPSDKAIEVNNREIRYPCHVSDIASICYQITEKQNNDCIALTGVYQWSGLEAMTKYEMILQMAEAFQCSTDNVIPVKEVLSASVKRPLNSQMDNSRLENLGISCHRKFKPAIHECLLPWYRQHYAHQN